MNDDPYTKPPPTIPVTTTSMPTTTTTTPDQPPELPATGADFDGIVLAGVLFVLGGAAILQRIKIKR